MESEYAKSDVDLKPKKCLPNRNGSLSLHLRSQAIILTNSEVAKATKDSSKNVAKTRSLIETSLASLRFCSPPYSGLFSWVKIFVKSSIRPPELNFVARWAVI